MRKRLIVIAAVAVAGAFALAACGGEADEPAGTPEPALPVEQDGGIGSADGTVPAGTPIGPEHFVGKSLEEAAAFAEELGRQWRVGRQDGEDFALTADFNPGRVTFTVEDGVVTDATIEEEDEQVVLPPDGSEDESKAELLARAVERLLTIDNTFGGENPFVRIEVANVVGGDPDRPVEPLALELIADSLQRLATVEFIPDAKAAIDRYFDGPPKPLAVVSIDDVRIDGERAEIDLAMWCGSLCGTWLTYEAELGAGGWEILGTTGPVAIS